MISFYYIVATIISILTFYLEYKRTKKHRITPNNTMFFEVNVELSWLKLNFKTSK